MGKVAEIVSKLQSFTVEKQVSDILVIVRDHEEDILDMNRAQLFAGKDSAGESLGEYHNPVYRELKSRLNPADVVDLKLTGAFYSGFFMKATSFPVLVDSHDSKRNLLINKDGYGENVFGLSKDHKETLRQDILKEPIQKYYRKVLQL